MEPEFSEEGYQEYEGWVEPTVVREVPTGLGLASITWNLLTLVEDLILPFAKVIRNFRADLEVTYGQRQKDKTFASSVEQGIESL